MYFTLKAMAGSSGSAQTMQVQKFPEILAFWKQLTQLGSLGAAKPKQKQLLTASTVYQSIKLCRFNKLIQSNQLKKIMYFLNVFFTFAISPA